MTRPLTCDATMAAVAYKVAYNIVRGYVVTARQTGLTFDVDHLRD